MAKRILRPDKSRWSMMFCCNDPDNGGMTNRVEAVEFGIGRGNFEFGTDFLDDHDLQICGPSLTFRWLDSGKRFRLGRRTFSCEGYRPYVGNWCWDACFVGTNTVRLAAELLKGRKWSPESGSEILWNWWEKIAERQGVA